MRQRVEVQEVLRQVAKGAGARWMKEIEKRREDIETGRVVCKPIDEALRNIREKLRDARSQPPEGS